jgi:hypothetical protein
MRSKWHKRQAIKKAKQAVQANSDEKLRRCSCGNLLRYSGDCCEECWVTHQVRWHGHDQSVNIKL